VQLTSEPPVGLLDLIRLCITADAENAVVIVSH
jgi:hypothetical protein